MSKNYVILELPQNNEHVQISVNGYEGVDLEATYNSTEQYFLILTSGLRVPAINVSYWYKF